MFCLPCYSISSATKTCACLPRPVPASKRLRALFEQRWGKPSKLVLRAAELAGSYRRLYASKALTDKAAAPWSKPCTFELQAAMEQLTRRKSSDKELALVYLLDGSGSVHEEDFTTMVNFVTDATHAVKAEVPECKVCVIQFSNDVRVEIPTQCIETGAFDAAMKEMVRMNGGTNIAVAIQKAGQLLKRDVPEDAVRIIVLITDGRVDSYQAKEARQMACRLLDEQQNIAFFAFGVGRGVDKNELLHIIGSKDDEDASERYLDLYVRDEAPW